MKKYKIGVIGAGTVGKSLVRMLEEQNSIIRDKFSVELELVGVATRTPSKVEKDFPCPVFSDWKKITEDPTIQIVVELIGGTSTAWEIAQSCLNHKKTFITANKALISEKGESLFPLAESNKVEVGYEASVAGAIPVIRALRNSLGPNSFTSIAGILNGTTNFILSKMELENLDYEEALKIAQDLGFAEADPSFDVEGIDVAHKIGILTRLAFGKTVAFSDITAQGITKISQSDIENAGLMGYRIKLLGIAKTMGEKILATVQPVLLSKKHPLANVMNENNAVFYDTNFSGTGMLFGAGAGGNPTASAVLADILYYAGRIDDTASNYEFSERNIYPNARSASLLDESYRFYIRFTTVDKPGVLSYISQILGKNGISISSVNQKESVENEPTAVLITTHMATYKSLRLSIEEIDKNKDIIREASVAFPLLENL